MFSTESLHETKVIMNIMFIIQITLLSDSCKSKRKVGINVYWKISNKEINLLEHNSSN